MYVYVRERERERERERKREGEGVERRDGVHAHTCTITVSLVLGGRIGKLPLTTTSTPTTTSPKRCVDFLLLVLTSLFNYTFCFKFPSPPSLSAPTFNHKLQTNTFRTATADYIHVHVYCAIPLLKVENHFTENFHYEVPNT